MTRLLLLCWLAVGTIATLWFLRCRHLHTRKQRVTGTLHLVCEDCGRSWPAITWTAAEKKRARALQQRMARSQSDHVVNIESRRAR